MLPPVSWFLSGWTLEVAKISLADLVTFEEGVSEGPAGHFGFPTLRVSALPMSVHLQRFARAWRSCVMELDMIPRSPTGPLRAAPHELLHPWNAIRYLLPTPDGPHRAGHAMAKAGTGGALR